MTFPQSRIETFPISDSFTLAGLINSGRLSVITTPGLTEVTLTISGFGPRADDMVANTRTFFDGTTLRCEIPPANHLLAIGSFVRVDAQIPTESNINVSVTSGSLHLSGSLATVTAQSSSGSIRLGHAHYAQLAASSGSIVVEQADELHAETSSGSIQVGTLAGSSTLRASSGSIKVDDAHGDVSVESTSGTVSVRQALGNLWCTSRSGSVKVERMSSGYLEARSTSGSIRIGIPTGTALNADVSSVNGRVRSDLTPVASGEGFEQTVAVLARSVNGSITLSRA